jgi:coronin-7
MVISCIIRLVLQSLWESLLIVCVIFQVKLWHIPEKGLEESLCNAECTFSHKQRRVETVCFHPTADSLLTTTSYTTLTLWDISSEKEMLCKCYRHM